MNGRVINLLSFSRQSHCRRCMTLSLVLWYADLINGCELIFVPEHSLCMVPFTAVMDSNLNYLCESFRIRVIPCLTTLKLMVCVRIAAHHGRVETGEILLAPWTTCTSQTPAVKDNIFTKKDVSSAHQRVRLVVLGYCHSARGEIKAAKGGIGMARSFLGARARSVLMALWALSDEATMTMKYFHKELVAGKRASEALRQATNFMREIEWLGKVRNWAPFVLIGDYVTLDLPQRLSSLDFGWWSCKCHFVTVNY